jgi:ferric-dicitrate binding protein FerR (iron transport regulator)
MRKPLVSLAVLFMVFAQAWAENQQSAPTALPIGSATIAEFKGQVSIHSPQGQIVAAQSGLTLAAESTIEIGKGSLLLNLADGSQVLVKSHSQVVLRQPSQDKGVWLELLIGKVIARIQKRLTNTPPFRIGTPTAVITVRGTRFSVNVNKKHRTTVEVFEGLVEVEGFGGTGPPVMIRPGFRTWVEQDRAPERPHEIMENLREGPERGGRGRPGMEGETEHENRQRPGSPPDNRGEPENEPH